MQSRIQPPHHAAAQMMQQSLMETGGRGQAVSAALAYARMWDRSAELSRKGRARDAAYVRALYWRQVAKTIEELP